MIIDLENGTTAVVFTNQEFIEFAVLCGCRSGDNKFRALSSAVYYHGLSMDSDKIDETVKQLRFNERSKDWWFANQL